MNDFCLPVPNILPKIRCVFFILGGVSTSVKRDDGSSGLQDVFERIEEVVLAAQGLQEVTVVMKELSDVASSNRRTTPVMTNSQAQQLQAAFSCTKQLFSFIYFFQICYILGVNFIKSGEKLEHLTRQNE